MEGRNQMVLCQAEMNRAVEHYLNNVVMRESYPVVVTGTTLVRNSDCVFEVHLENPPAKELAEVGNTSAITQSTAIARIADNMELWGHKDVPADGDLLRSRINSWVRQLRAL